ncbi:Sensory/regulatory protein RpfC [Xanthomonas arboricola pv. corylina]|uniref:Sensory/regulatory protein RpfC n=3 Tax=Xanthomonas arboricola TaxID=56448 RepID=A0A2S7CAR6_9XANT|nr:hybrid sensor histidine kinase/response regulator [Xanthomonas arboricola pv. corylina]QUI82454.1 response regulator [Xanthomonas arboricola pv. corylina]UQQ09053.1 response regulator [Xanthomonas arboricola pv. corylina]CAE6780669.1 Sensory/regulatory protein RpfC [Xanthomonas arboricola pv. corylina]CAE6780689.1 Sensory/regulatory protein RpfC [Xanthomonas arboricola pv. corylina]
MNPFGRIRQRLMNRPDSEHGQAIVRIVLISLILSYVLVPSVRHSLPLHQHTGVLVIVLTGLGLGLALFGWLLWRPDRSDARRILGMLADYGLMAAGMIQMGEPLAWVYVVVMWVTVGNGLRYGNRYLYLAVAMAVVSFSTTLSMTEYWQHNQRLGVGLEVGLAAVPLYFSSLLRQLTRATAEARRASEAKSRFLANMSHEFRTPLNGLSGMTEVLATTRLDDEQRECLKTIQASTRSLLALVEEVLDISAIEAGKLRINASDFAVHDTLQAIGLILEPQAKAKGLRYQATIAADVPPRVRGDAGHLQQILLNLVGNAVKFTDHGSVQLKVAATDASGRAGLLLRFEVLDTGIGVPVDMRPRLFEAFEQADTGLARRFEGSGLGTTIARGLVQSMGGAIGFEENPEGGSLFWFELPFGLATAKPAATPSPVLHETESTTIPGNVIAFADPFLRHRARVRSMQILVADDHLANCLVLQRLLQKAGHRVTCVDGGEAVLDALAEADYDAAIVDLHMPGVSGLDMLKQLRVMQAGGKPGTPIVVLSADVTPESIRSCEQAGAYAFLAKPVAAIKLLDTLAEIAVNQKLRQTDLSIGTRSAAPSGAVLDPAVLDELAELGMGNEFEREFIQQCLSDAAACVVQLGKAAADGDWARLREHAHAVKGVSSNLGLVMLAEQGGELMRLPEAQLRAEWSQRLEQLKTGLKLGREALAQRAQNKSDGGVSGNGDRG